MINNSIKMDSPLQGDLPVPSPTQNVELDVIFVNT